MDKGTEALQHISSGLIELHQLFIAWYRGDGEQDVLEAKITAFLDPSFQMVFPDATVVSREELLSMMVRDYGNTDDYIIELHDISVQAVDLTVFVAQYQEWQYWGGDVAPKVMLQSSAVVKWVDSHLTVCHIHETDIST